MSKKDFSQMSLEKVLKYIIKEFHIPTRKTLEKLRSIVTDVNEDDINKYPNLKFLGELFVQFKGEYLKHMENEEVITFPTIIKYEKLLNSGNVGMKGENKLNYVEMKNEHEVFSSYLVSIVGLFEGLELDKKIKKLQNLFIEIKENNIEHGILENEIVYLKGNEFQDKLIGK